jgi:hypothetical protein
MNTIPMLGQGDPLLGREFSAEEERSKQQVGLGAGSSAGIRMIGKADSTGISSFHRRKSVPRPSLLLVWAWRGWWSAAARCRFAKRSAQHRGI